MGIAVIGGGIAGITAALDLADSGYKVYLIERNPRLGGKVAILAECETGISPRIVKLEHHPNVELMLSSDLEALSGSAGNFTLTVSGKQLKAESILLAPGYDVFENIPKSYAIDHPDVVTSLEFEAMLKACTASEPGLLVRPSDGRPVLRIGFIKCIGSRCQENEICSTACCGYTAKEVWELKERYPAMKVYVFYMDVRTFGKDEELVAKLKDKYGVVYLRSRVPEVTPENGSLIVKYEDLANGTIERLPLDMVVLAVGLLPAKTLGRLARITGVKTDKYGFIETRLTAPLETSVPGIFAAGTATAPMKVRESVGQASGAALRAAQLSAPTEMIPGQEPRKYLEVGGKAPKIGVFLCNCAGDIAERLDIPAVAAHVQHLRQVAVVNTAPTTLEQTMEAIESGVVDQGLNRIVVAGFSPRAYEGIFRDACAKAGLNPYLLEMVNLREQCAWVQDKADATKAAMSQMTMAVERARYLEPIPLESYPVTPKALVVGGGVAGMNAALDIAKAGYDVYLVEKDAALGGRLMEATELQSGEKAVDFLQQLVDKVKRTKKITVYTKAAVKNVRGRVGAFKAQVTGEGGDKEIDFGVAVLATGATEFVPTGYFGYGQDKKVMTQSEFAKLLEGALAANTIVLIQDAFPDVGVPSKYSSIEAVSNALKAKKKNPAANVFLLYQETKTYGKWETLYKEAREHGVIFLRFDKERPPKLADGILSVFDLILNDELQIKPDLLVLSTPMLPAAENEELSKLFMVPLTRYGFFMEAQERPKLVMTPVDTANEGVFICGSAVYPGMVDETLAMSSAAAARASVILAKNFLETPGIVSVVNEEICSGCGVCVELCPVEAIELVEEPVSAVTYGIMTVTGGKRVVARITEGCIGCGSCAALCPSSAMTLKNFKDQQLYAQVDFA